jgi:hypothetical protein
MSQEHLSLSTIMSQFRLKCVGRHVPGRGPALANVAAPSCPAQLRLDHSGHARSAGSGPQDAEPPRSGACAQASASSAGTRRPGGQHPQDAEPPRSGACAQASEASPAAGRAWAQDAEPPRSGACAQASASSLRRGGPGASTARCRTSTLSTPRSGFGTFPPTRRPGGQHRKMPNLHAQGRALKPRHLPRRRGGPGASTARCRASTLSTPRSGFGTFPTEQPHQETSATSCGPARAASSSGGR